MSRRCGLVGLGEVGESLAGSLLDQGHEVRAFENRIDTQTHARASRLGIEVDVSVKQFAEHVDAVLVATPGSAAAELARLVTPALSPGVVYADLSSKPPEVRDEVAAACAEHALEFCDVAITDTVAWADRPVELLASGGGAHGLTALLEGTRFQCVDVGQRPCSAEIKLCRSIFTKGLSALLLETYVTSDALGVTDVVEAGVGRILDETPERITDLLLGTALQHARRRAEEADAVARFVEATNGWAPMACATRELLWRLQASAEGGGAEFSAGRWRDVVSTAREVGTFRATSEG